MGRFWHVTRRIVYTSFLCSSGLYVYLAWFADLRYQRIFLEDQVFNRGTDALLSTAVLDTLREVSVQDALRDHLLRLCADQRIVEAVAAMLSRALLSEELRPALFTATKDVLCRMLRSAAMTEYCANLLLKLAADPHIAPMLARSLAAVLRDDKVAKAAVEIAYMVLADEVVQEKVSLAAIKYLLAAIRDPTEYVERYPLLRQMVQLLEEQIESVRNT